MSLNFPSKPNIQLENSPLVEVVCQVRFPIILRIAKEEPSEFQEIIRHKFPQMIQEQGLRFKLPHNEESATVEPHPVIYRFLTPDEKNAISLTANFFALSSNNYTNWEDFSLDLSLASEAVQTVYTPTYATRIGLRYVNRFTLENTNQDKISGIYDLFRPELTAQLHSEAWSEPVEMQTQLRLSDNEEQFTLSTRSRQNPAHFLLDFDYFEEGQLDLKTLLEKCRHYNDVIYRAFRWCVDDKKLSVFKPVEKKAPN